MIPKPQRRLVAPAILPLAQGVVLRLGAAAGPEEAQGIGLWQRRFDAALARGAAPYPLVVDRLPPPAGEGDESYALELGPEEGQLRASGPGGVRQGLARALQWPLAPAPVHAVSIADAPALPCAALCSIPPAIL